MSKYIVGIDQSTSGTKVVLFNENAKIISRYDCKHQQKIKDGWVSHDPMEIYKNVLDAVEASLYKSRIASNDILAVGVSNQRETALVWDSLSGLPIDDAIVWHCARAGYICDRLADKGPFIKERTGLQLSPYFSAAKIAWLLEHQPTSQNTNLKVGTIDSWLLYKLTGEHKTDFSNASRTQLFNINDLTWDEEICRIFGIDSWMLPEVCDSNALFGETDFAGRLPRKIPVYGVLGDSSGALYGQGCTSAGMLKATYGTGSSVMLNIGDKPILNKDGLVTSLAWSMDGHVNYVLEGNINYTGDIIKWLVEQVGLIFSFKEAGEIAKTANPEDTTYFVPAFTGLGAPYWKSSAKASFIGISRNTGKAEFVKAAEECIAYQIADIIQILRDTGIEIKELRVDGGPTRDYFLMQFQSDILNMELSAPDIEELSVFGAVCMAGKKIGLFTDNVNEKLNRVVYQPIMEENKRIKKYAGWKDAVARL